MTTLSARPIDQSEASIQVTRPIRGQYSGHTANQYSHLPVGQYLAVHLSAADKYLARHYRNPGQDSVNKFLSNFVKLFPS